MSDEEKRRKTIDKHTASRITLWMDAHADEFHQKIDRVMLVDRIREDFDVEICADRAVSMAKICNIKLRSKPRESKLQIVEQPPLIKGRATALANVLEQILQDAEQQLGCKPGDWGRKNGARRSLNRICNALPVHPGTATAQTELPVKVAAKQAVAATPPDIDDVEEPRSHATKTR